MTLSELDSMLSNYPIYHLHGEVKAVTKCKELAIEKLYMNHVTKTYPQISGLHIYYEETFCRKILLRMFQHAFHHNHGKKENTLDLLSLSIHLSATLGVEEGIITQIIVDDLVWSYQCEQFVAFTEDYEMSTNGEILKVRKR